jgi:hypothetical protein
MHVQHEFRKYWKGQASSQWQESCDASKWSNLPMKKVLVDWFSEWDLSTTLRNASNRVLINFTLFAQMTLEGLCGIHVTSKWYMIAVEHSPKYSLIYYGHLSDFCRWHGIGSASNYGMALSRKWRYDNHLKSDFSKHWRNYHIALLQTTYKGENETRCNVEANNRP